MIISNTFFNKSANINGYGVAQTEKSEIDYILSDNLNMITVMSIIKFEVQHRS